MLVSTVQKNESALFVLNVVSYGGDIYVGKNPMKKIFENKSWTKSDPF